MAGPPVLAACPAEAALARLAQTELLCRAGSFELRWPATLTTLSPGLRALLGGTAGAAEQGALQTLDSVAWIPARERRLVCKLWAGARLGETFEFVHTLLDADGAELQVLHRGLLMAPEQDGAPPVGIAILQDVTARRSAEERIVEALHVDEVTGLPNRLQLLPRLAAALRVANTDSAGVALLSIRTPRVGDVALTMGAAAGDELARSMARRLQGLGLAQACIAAFGGGEFVLFAPQPREPDANALLRLAEGCRTALEAPVTVGSVDIIGRCHIGIASFPGDAHVPDAPETLLAAAQSARHDAETAGEVRFFEPASNTRALRQLQLETALRQALARQELHLVYQPQVSLDSGRIVGVEALLRWQSPAWGAVEPGEFIPIAERTGLIDSIGSWALRQACEQSVRWRERGLPQVRVSVNIAPQQLHGTDMVERVRTVLAETGASAGSLALEFTERALASGGPRIGAALKALRQMGVEVVLDDLGTGYFSLSSLRNLPISLVKVDRSFVGDVTAAPESASVTRSIIHLAHGLQIPVLAEGVETQGQVNMLVASGCDRLQGHVFSAPVSADEVSALLQGGRVLQGHRREAVQRRRTLMLVDDEQNIVSALKRLFRRDGYTLVTANSGAEALELLARHEVDVIVSDQRMPGMTGVDFLRRAKQLHPDSVRMTLSGFTDLQSIIDAVNEGAVYKFLTKPWDDELLRGHVAAAFAHKELADDNRRLEREVATANVDQAALNQRLEQMLARQRQQARLIEVSVGGLRDMVEALPVGVYGIDPDGLLAFANRRAAELIPDAAQNLLGPPGAPVAALLQALRERPPQQAGRPLSTTLHGRPLLAWRVEMPPTEVARGELLVLAEPGAPEPAP